MPDRGLMQNRHYMRIRSHRYPTVGEEPYKRLIYDPGLVTRIILNRPRYLNTTSHAHICELEDAFDRAAEDDNCNVIVLSGAGTCFCSGDDNTGLTPESAPTLLDGDDPAPGDYNGTVTKLIAEYGSENAVWNEYNIEHDYLVGWWQFNKLRTQSQAHHRHGARVGHLLWHGPNHNHGHLLRFRGCPVPERARKEAHIFAKGWSTSMSTGS